MVVNENARIKELHLSRNLREYPEIEECYKRDKMAKNKKSSKPIMKVSSRLVNVAVFENTVKVKGKKTKIRNVVPSRSYQDEDDEWQHVNSYGIADIPDLVLCLTELYKAERLKVHDGKKEEDDEDEDEDDV